MDRNAICGIKLMLLLTSMLLLVFDIKPARTGFSDRKVGVNVGDWVEYVKIGFSWESNVSYDELDEQTKFFVRTYEDVFYWRISILEISGTLVKFRWLWCFKNGTEYVSYTYWKGKLVNASFVDVATGSYSNMLLIASNLSVGEAVYTNYPDWIITETIVDMYLGESREVNILSFLDIYNRYTFESIMVKWDRATGILLEFHLQSDEQKRDNQTFRFNAGIRVLETSRWGVRWIREDLNNDGKVDIQDISIAALTFGSYFGHPMWNPMADINQDGKVDIRDLVLIAKNFGKHTHNTNTCC